MFLLSRGISAFVGLCLLLLNNAVAASTITNHALMSPAEARAAFPNCGVCTDRTTSRRARDPGLICAISGSV